MDQSEVRGILKKEPTEPAGFSDDLAMGSERERGEKNDSKVFEQIVWKGGYLPGWGGLHMWPGGDRAA